MLRCTLMVRTHPNNSQHTAPAALDSQQVARLCDGRYVNHRGNGID